MSKKIPVIEYFGPTVQGEGVMAGKITNFLRFGGCPFRCSWCDTMYAVLPEEVKKNATYMSQEEIIQMAKAGPHAPWITLTGGDPVMWELDDVVTSLMAYDYRINVETEAFLWRDWLRSVNVVTMSPKPPSSKMAEKNSLVMIEQYLQETRRAILKLVVFDHHDFEWARGIRERFQGVPMYLSVGTNQGLSDEETKGRIVQRLGWLYDLVIAHPDMHSVVTLPQLHVLAWGTKRGV